MTSSTNIISAIENGIAAVILAAMPQLTEVDIHMRGLMAAVTPSFACKFTGGGLEPLTHTRYRCRGRFAIVLAVNNVVDDKSRRQMAYPILLAMAALLANQDLGLDIGPILPDALHEANDGSLQDSGTAIWQLVVRTRFYIEMTPDAADPLVLFANQYFLGESPAAAGVGPSNAFPSPAARAVDNPVTVPGGGS